MKTLEINKKITSFLETLSILNIFVFNISKSKNKKYDTDEFSVNLLFLIDMDKEKLRQKVIDFAIASGFKLSFLAVNSCLSEEERDEDTGDIINESEYLHEQLYFSFIETK